MSEVKSKTAVIAGAGPAGLTAAYELLKTTDIKPVIFESSEYVGGISKTVTYKGNRIDIGGHRFFSKSDRVMKWWLNILPLEEHTSQQVEITYQNQRRNVTKPTEAEREQKYGVMLVRNRKSRIYFNKQLFDYPISLSLDTLLKLGLLRSLKIAYSYSASVFRPIRPERTLEQFLINRFGKELYRTFFESYTEKVWGVPCGSISSEWGAQRIKGLSVGKAVAHKLKSFFSTDKELTQKKIETSLIERFLYPEKGPGQMWEAVADIVVREGGELYKNNKIVGIEVRDNKVVSVQVKNTNTGDLQSVKADYLISTMPVCDLINALRPQVASDLSDVANGLVYRDFITVGLLVNKMALSDEGSPGNKMVSDNWIYIQEPDVRLGRLQIFNNWSPAMVADPEKVWLGLEYFCKEGDDLWTMPDDALISFAAEELSRIRLIDKTEVIEGMVLRELKTYPAYFGAYDSFSLIQEQVNKIENLFLVGRNGMHRYNNQDHSMLTAMTAVENIKNGITDKTNIWAVNTESDYHEERR